MKGIVGAVMDLSSNPPVFPSSSKGKVELCASSWYISSCFYRNKKFGRGNRRKSQRAGEKEIKTKQREMEIERIGGAYYSLSWVRRRKGQYAPRSSRLPSGGIVRSRSLLDIHFKTTRNQVKTTASKPENWHEGQQTAPEAEKDTEVSDNTQESV